MIQFVVIPRLVVLAALAWISLVPAQAAPRLFFTDLESGPNTGGEDGKGAFVTLYGKGFGATQERGSVTVGGGQVAAYRLWSDSRIIVQLGPQAKSGPIQVIAAAGTSNALNFTVRPGRIYFVTAKDTRPSGSLGRTFNSLLKCKNALRPGDICYVMDGVVQTGMEAYAATLSFRQGGEPDRPMALVAYPKAHARIGDPDDKTVRFGIRIPSIKVEANYWVIAGLDISGYTDALLLHGGGNTGWRIVGNRFSCPNGDGPEACVVTSGSRNIRLLGNEISQAGCKEPDHPCALYRSRVRVTSAGGVLKGAGPLYPLMAGDVVRIQGQERKVLAVTGPTASLDRPFDPEITEETEFESRHPMPSKLYHTLYFGTDSNDVEVGWNYLHDNHSCRGIQFHSSPTSAHLPPPATPELSSEAGNSALPARLYKVRTTYLVRWDQPGTPSYRETTPSVEASIHVPAGHVLRVRSPKLPDPLVGGYGVYLATEDAPGPQRQNPVSAPVPIGTDWVEPVSGPARNGAPPERNFTYTNGTPQFNLDIHDNIIRDQVCDGLNLATVDPSRGPVRAYNNLISHVGLGPDPPPDSASYSCIFVPGTTNNGAGGKGDVEIFNNTLFDCGRRGGGAAAAVSRGRFSPEMRMVLWNNIVVQPPKQPYVLAPNPELVRGDHNLWFGAGTLPAQLNRLTNNIYGDPRFTAPEKFDFHLQPGSAASGSGRGTGAPATDFDGMVRPQGAPASLGAYERPR